MHSHLGILTHCAGYKIQQKIPHLSVGIVIGIVIETVIEAENYSLIISVSQADELSTEELHLVRRLL